MIPKIIWALWLGDMEESIVFYKKRIEDLHRGGEWQINIITDKLYLERMFNQHNETFMTELLNHPVIDFAKKSDAIRFFLLKYYGGFWIDLSTFLFSSLDSYYNDDEEKSFIGMYTQSYMVERIFVDSFNKMSDGVNTQLFLSEEYHRLQSRHIKLKNEYKAFPFIPESFFVACEPNHKITENIFSQLKKFWTLNLREIDSKQTLCQKMNDLMNTLSHKVFDIDILEYELIDNFPDDNSDENLIKFKNEMKNRMWNCAYIYIYLQMYIALVDYIKAGSNPSITQSEGDISSDFKYKDELCTFDQKSNINFCKTITIKRTEETKTISLVPLSLYRLIKWGNTEHERVTFEKTQIYESLKDVETRDEAEAIIAEYVKNGIYQIKFSHWTRGNEMPKILMRLFGPPTVRGGKKHKTQKIMKKQKRKRSKKNLSKFH
jgi:hypothetical protein